MICEESKDGRQIKSNKMQSFNQVCMFCSTSTFVGLFNDEDSSLGGGRCYQFYVLKLLIFII